MDAAQHQLEAAIRLTFSGEHPAAIHSMADAAYRVLRDICEARGDIASYCRIEALVEPSHKRDFWAAINCSGDFFKHADRDSTAIHEMDEEETDFVIVFATRLYCHLGYTPTAEMNAFMIWFIGCHPEILLPVASAFLATAEPFRTISGELRLSSRSDRLTYGLRLLKQELQQAISS
jgi:hypothetical protein